VNHRDRSKRSVGCWLETSSLGMHLAELFKEQ